LPPISEETEGKTVQALHSNQDTDLTDVTVVVRDGDKDAEAVLHTTWHHPFWVPVVAAVFAVPVVAFVILLAVRSRSRQRQQEVADDHARHQAFGAWFEAVGRARPTGLPTLTSELLQAVGSPYAPLGQRAIDDPVYFFTAKYYGQAWAERLSRQALLESDLDAGSRAQFWDSVARWF
jgi:hypothetical protein